MNKNIHIACDFDRTLAHYESKKGLSYLGPAIPQMLEKVKDWLNKGYKVSIFTARVSLSGHSQVEMTKQKILIQDWLIKNGLPELEITADKQPKFTHFVDDKAIGVEPNTGRMMLFEWNLV